MTQEAMKDFAAALRGDEEMASGLIGAIDGKRDDEAAEAFATYARARGFEVTRSDVEAVRDAAMARETLSDDQLDTVAGGTFGGGSILGGGPSLLEPVLGWVGIFR